MYKFKRLNRGQGVPSSADIHDFAAVIKLCLKHKHQLFDDFSAGDVPLRVARLVEEAGDYFWVVKRKRDEAFVGFIYLYDIIGGRRGACPKGSRVSEARGEGDKCLETAYSGVLGTCFEREFWGEAVERVGQKFLRHTFSRLGFKKLKCEVYRSNPYVAELLKRLGFVLEGRLRAETLVRGKAEDILLWGLLAENAVVLASPACAGTHRTGLRAQKKGGSPPPDYTSRSINNRKIIPIFEKKRKD